MSEKDKLKLLVEFAENLYSRGLAESPEKYDYEKIAYQFLKGKEKGK